MCENQLGIAIHHVLHNVGFHTEEDLAPQRKICLAELLVTLQSLSKIKKLDYSVIIHEN